jgi:hypothetical protein
MARWKAIYLYNGYDGVWSIIQRLRDLVGLPALPPVRLDQDDTMATGNWSARELCGLLNVDRDILDGVEGGLETGIRRERFW